MPTALPDTFVEKTLALLGKAHTAQDVAKLLGVSKSVVNKIRRRPRRYRKEYHRQPTAKPIPMIEFQRVPPYPCPGCSTSMREVMVSVSPCPACLARQSKANQ